MLDMQLHQFTLKTALILLLITYISCDQPIKNLLSTTQFYFIPNSSYFQYRVSTAQLGKFTPSTSISQVIATLNMQIANKNTQGILFNTIVFPPLSTTGQQIQFYQCYMRSAFEGLTNTTCQINSQNSINGNCTLCVKSAILSTLPTACLRCNLSILVDVVENLDQDDRADDYIGNQNLIIIIDNTNVLQLTGKYLEMYLKYDINIKLNENDQTVIIFFLIMLIVLITVTIIIAIYLTVKIKSIKVVIANYIKQD